jgi:hypothetical protein
VRRPAAGGCIRLDVKEFLRVLTRRWYAVLCAVAVGAGAALVVLGQRPVYEAHGSVLFLAPESRINRNVYTAFPSSLIATADVVSRAVGDGATRAEMRAAGYAQYTVKLIDRGNQWVPIHDQPTLIVSARGGDAGQAQRTLEAVAQRIDSDLRSRQRAAGARPALMIRSEVVGATAVAVEKTGNRKRALAAVLLLTGAGVAAAASGAEGLARRRRDRRDRRGRHDPGAGRGGGSLDSAGPARPGAPSSGGRRGVPVPVPSSRL